VRDTGNAAVVDKVPPSSTAIVAAGTVKAEPVAQANADFTFRVLGKRSGVGHKGFSSDDLKRACAAALLQTNQADWGDGAVACVDDAGEVSRAGTTSMLVNGRDSISDNSSNSSSSGRSRSEKLEASALACRLRRVNAHPATTIGNCTAAASTTATTPAGSGQSSEAKRQTGPKPHHLTFLARVHDTSFSFLLLLHDGTLSRPHGQFSSAPVQ